MLKKGNAIEAIAIVARFTKPTHKDIIPYHDTQEKDVRLVVKEITPEMLERGFHITGGMMRFKPE